MTTATVPDQAAVAVEQLHPNPWNRKRFDKQKLEELKASIEKVGVLQALVVRPHPKNGGYEIVAGERRWRASKLAKKTEVPVTVRDLTDVEVVEVLAIENSQREDVHPLEEAAHFRFLLDHGESYDVDAIAAKVGKSKSYVYQRLKLADLVPEARERFEKNELLAGHAILIARLQPKDQEAAIKEMTASWRRGDMSVGALETWIEDEVHLELKKAPFNTKDEKLVKNAGSCTDCPKRSGFTPDLFPELKKRDVCTDRTCFNKKVQAHITRKIDAHKKKGVELAKVAGDYGKKGKGVVARWDWWPAKKGAKNAQPAIVVTGPDRGKVIYVTIEKPQATPTRTQRTNIDNERLSEITQDVIAERARELADHVLEVVKEIPVEGELAVFLAENFGERAGWPGGIGRKRYWSSYQRTYLAAIAALLPGSWTEPRDVWSTYHPKDAEAARHLLAYEVWYARDTAGLDKEIEREAKKRLRAERRNKATEERKKQRAEASAKKSKSKKATSTKKRSKKGAS